MDDFKEFDLNSKTMDNKSALFYLKKVLKSILVFIYLVGWLGAAGFLVFIFFVTGLTATGMKSPFLLMCWGGFFICLFTFYILTFIRYLIYGAPVKIPKRKKKQSNPIVLTDNHSSSLEEWNSNQWQNEHKNQDEFSHPLNYGEDIRNDSYYSNPDNFFQEFGHWHHPIPSLEADPQLWNRQEQNHPFNNQQTGEYPIYTNANYRSEW